MAFRHSHPMKSAPLAVAPNRLLVVYEYFKDNEAHRDYALVSWNADILAPHGPGWYTADGVKLEPLSWMIELEGGLALAS